MYRTSSLNAGYTMGRFVATFHFLCSARVEGSAKESVLL
jgi:hypothetical protein